VGVLAAPRALLAPSVAARDACGRACDATATSRQTATRRMEPWCKWRARRCSTRYALDNGGWERECEEKSARKGVRERECEKGSVRKGVRERECERPPLAPDARSAARLAPPPCGTRWDTSDLRTVLTACCWPDLPRGAGYRACGAGCAVLGVATEHGAWNLYALTR